MDQSRSPREDARSADVTASEVASFAYCAKAWHLERVLGAPATPTAQQRRQSGIKAHAEHGRQILVDRGHRRSRLLIAALLMIAVALLALAALVK